MPAELGVPLELLYAFLLVLARVSGALAFVPLPGFSSSPLAPRVVLVAGITLALLPAWPRVTGEVGLGRMLAWLAAEAALGVTAGVVVAFLNEAFVLGSQVFGLQAGYSYASTIDPTTQADSGVLQILMQLSASLLFFATGMDRHLVRAFAASLEAFPPGAFQVSLRSADEVIRLGSGMFTTGLRLALPVITLLVLVDLALALLGRINSQLQLLTLAFPAKMLASIAMLVLLAALLPAIYQGAAERTVRALFALIAAGRPAVAAAI